MIQENDIVITKQHLTNIPINSVGVVVLVYLNGKSFEVEFTIDGESKVECVLRNQIEKV